MLPVPRALPPLGLAGPRQRTPVPTRPGQLVRLHQAVAALAVAAPRVCFSKASSSPSDPCRPKSRPAKRAVDRDVRFHGCRHLRRRGDGHRLTDATNPYPALSPAGFGRCRPGHPSSTRSSLCSTPTEQRQASGRRLTWRTIRQPMALLRRHVLGAQVAREPTVHRSTRYRPKTIARYTPLHARVNQRRAPSKREHAPA